MRARAGGADPEDPEDRGGRFQDLYDTTYASVLGYALRRAATPDDAADVVSETYLIAWRRFAEMPDRDHWRPWLFGVARRVLANHNRGHQRRTRLAERLRSELAKQVDTQLTDPSSVVEVAAVVSAFNQLNLADREVLSLVAWERLSYSEIAHMLGCSQTAVRIRVYRARRRLTRLLIDEGESVQGPSGTDSATEHALSSSKWEDMP